MKPSMFESHKLLSDDEIRFLILPQENTPAVNTHSVVMVLYNDLQKHQVSLVKQVVSFVYTVHTVKVYTIYTIHVYTFTCTK